MGCLSHRSHSITSTACTGRLDIPQPHLPSDTPTAHNLNLPFTMEEVEAGLRRLNNGRSGGLLGYTSELLRYGKHPVSEEVPVPEHLLAPCITALFNMAFSTGTIPEAWRTSLVTPIHKRGDATDPSNYRPIAVGEPLYRLYTTFSISAWSATLSRAACDPQLKQASGQSSALYIRHSLSNTLWTCKSTPTSPCTSALWTSRLHMTRSSGT